jgi:DNA-binding NtrC family response regulator
MLNVLLVEDDENVRQSVAAALIGAGHQVTEVTDGLDAVDLLGSEAFDLAICDVNLPRLDGMALFRRIKREAPDTAVVMMTSYARIPDVVDSMRDGAVDYVTKPFDPDDFTRRVIGPIAEHRALRRQFECARAQLAARATGAELVAESPAMRSLADRVAVLAQSDASVIVTGERGVGKDLVARTLHAQGSRKDGPFAFVDACSLGDLLAVSERLPASDGGAAPSWFRDALGGTLVLEGVEGLSPRLQAMLVRIISAPGAVARRDLDWNPRGVRLVTVSRQGLSQPAASRQLLQSLYYRLNGATVHVPTLAERAADLCPLANVLLREIQPPGKTLPGLTVAAWNALVHYPFPGNVSELRWILEHALAMSEGSPIDRGHLPEEVLGSGAG